MRHHNHDHRHDHRHDHDHHDRRHARTEHPSGHHAHGEHRGRRGGLGRFFAHGDLRLVILHLIAEKPRHGYEIIKEIEDRVAGAYTPSPGVIYPTLTMLEELGHVTVTQGDGAKKLHAITETGRAMLDANRATLDPILARMDEAKGTQPATPPGPVLRAIENLRMALRLRLARAPLDDAQARTIATALDAAATSVENA